MKLLSEVQQWCMGAAEQFGDPAEVTTQLFARFLPRVPDRPVGEVFAAYEREALLLAFEPGLVRPIPIDSDGPIADEYGQLMAFGMTKICSGVWSLKPSLNIPGLIHAFVIIYDVPAAAPWENRIIVVSSFSGR